MRLMTHEEFLTVYGEGWRDPEVRRSKLDCEALKRVAPNYKPDSWIASMNPLWGRGLDYGELLMMHEFGKVSFVLEDSSVLGDSWVFSVEATMVKELVDEMLGVADLTQRVSFKDLRDVEV